MSKIIIRKFENSKVRRYINGKFEKTKIRKISSTRTEFSISTPLKKIKTDVRLHRKPLTSFSSRFILSSNKTHILQRTVYMTLINNYFINETTTISKYKTGDGESNNSRTSTVSNLRFSPLERGYRGT
jgi:hypothetical protein